MCYLRVNIFLNFHLQVSELLVLEFEITPQNIEVACTEEKVNAHQTVIDIIINVLIIYA